MKQLRNIGLFLFFSFSLFIIVIFFNLLYDKITRPALKNLNSEELTWLGILAVLLFLINLLILSRFFKYARKIIDTLRGSSTTHRN